MRCYNFLPNGSSFVHEVLSGLARPQETRSPKDFYDARGRALLEELYELPECYPARSEFSVHGMITF